MGMDGSFLGGDMSWAGDDLVSPDEGKDDHGEDDDGLEEEDDTVMEGDEEEGMVSAEEVLFADQRHALHMVYQSSTPAEAKRKRMGPWPVYLASVETM